MVSGMCCLIRGTLLYSGRQGEVGEIIWTRRGRGDNLCNKESEKDNSDEVNGRRQG